MTQARIVSSGQYTEIGGRSVALHYSDPTAEYNALRNGAATVDRSHRHRLIMSGDGAAAALNGLVTNDITHLEPGRGQYAAALSPKGKIVADLRIFRRADGSYLVDTGPRAAPGWMGIVHKYVNPRTARYTEASATMSDLGVFGPSAAAQVGKVLLLDPNLLQSMEPFSLLETEWQSESLVIAAAPDLGVKGFDIFHPETASLQLGDAFVEAHVARAGHTAWEIARIEHGTPEWGLDMDDSTLVQEANMDKLHAISFTKGCYTGQEFVARVHFRGHVNQQLRMLRFVSTATPPHGSRVIGENGRDVGEVRSAARSPRSGGVAIAMVRRETPIGSSVTIRWGDAECQAGVYELPLEPTAA